MARPTIPSYSRRPDLEQSDNLPSTLVGMNSWFRADSITGLSDGDNVPAWSDDWGYDHLVQGVEADQPTWNLDQINGYPALNFNGTSDLMTGGRKNVTVSTIVAVARYSAAEFSDWSGIYTGQDALTNDEGLMVDAAGLPHSNIRNITADIYTDGVSATEDKNIAPTNDWHIIIWNDTAAPNTWANGIQIGKDRGNAQFWSGDIAEVMSFSSPVSLAANRDIIFNHLNNKYEIY